MSKPYPLTLHYDPTITDGRVWAGQGVDLHPACGQSEWIAVTGSPGRVDCLKCRRSSEYPGGLS